MGEPTTIAELPEPGWLFADPTRRRRMAALFTALIVMIGVWNAPIPGFRSRYQDATSFAYELVRLDQGWSYFSPEVGLVSPEVWIELDRESGETERWDFPDTFPVFGTFRSYRWIKWDEAIHFGELDPDPIFDFVMERVDTPGTVDEIHLVVALSAPTSGKAGPYDPNYTITRSASRSETDS